MTEQFQTLGDLADALGVPTHVISAWDLRQVNQGRITLESLRLVIMDDHEA